MTRSLNFGVLLLVVGVGCARPVVVGSKNFSEQVILGEMLALLLEEHGLRVDRKLNLGGSFICHRALLSGRMDVYVEYTGTALAAILKKPVVHDPEEVYRKVKREYQERFDLAWGPPLGFNNTYALAMRAGQAESLGIRRISDLAAHVDIIRTGFGHEFLERKDGFPGLTRAYGLDFATPPSGMELGLIYQALTEGEVDLVAGNSTDGLIEKFGLVVLEDDRRFFPPYDAAPVYRPQAARRYPALGVVLQTLAGQIDEATMRRLNRAVDNDRLPAREVARQFLLERKWVGPGRVRAAHDGRE
ncbi:MAG: glycine betaine ABC transporter substrate-binding protein [Acidobacteriota bacterium]